MKEKGITIVVCVIAAAIVIYAVVFISTRTRQSHDVKQTITTRQTPTQPRRVKRKRTVNTPKQSRVYRKYAKIVTEPEEMSSKVRFFSYPEASLIDCISYMELLEELKREAVVQMMTAEEFERKKNAIPLHGQMWVETIAFTLAAANPKYWSVIVEQNGKRVLKQDGVDSVPSFTVWSTSTIWKDYILVSLPKMQPRPFEVYVIDRLSNKRREYIVRPNYH